MSIQDFITRGQTEKFTGTVYTDKANGILANLTGSTVQVMMKKNLRDIDADALFTKAIGSGVTLISPLTSGQFEFVFSSADTNGIAQNEVFIEALTKLSDGSHVRTGPVKYEVKGNVIKTLP